MQQILIPKVRLSEKKEFSAQRVKQNVRTVSVFFFFDHFQTTCTLLK